MLPIDRKNEITRIKRLLHESDASIVRVIEDLIVVLIMKGVVTRSSFSPIVYENIKHRRELRVKLNELIKEEEEYNKGKLK